MTNFELLSRAELTAAGYGSRTTIWRRVRDGQFPSPVKIGALVRWRASDVEDWLDDQLSESAVEKDLCQGEP